ncbi:LOW QUALITY PROTEIN: transcription repressor OFP2-like [Cajanus cajan]|uniref:LOW QUALITY PROTEIN: transcription repressor OFP2-like n=1 Tax=Cajanus cajan TaxID=3821 RepID=UPI00098DB351|nr:LOW QUALITY PROTEIN: transcription repressor OFP2-like [Cajanus cajan]
MGNNRFRLSDMMPNAWFYKLKDMSKSRKRNGPHAMKNKVTSPTTTSQRCSNYFPSEPNIAGKLYNSPIFTKHSDNTFSDSPRRSSSKRRGKRKTIYKPSPTTLVSSPVIESFSCHSTNNWIKPNQPHSPDYYLSSLESSSESNNEYVSSESECDKFTIPDLLNGVASECSCRVSSSTNDIIIDMKNEPFPENLDGFDTISQLGLAPILTKPVKFDDKVNEATELRRSTLFDEVKAHQSLSVKVGKEESSRTKRERKTSSIARISSANSTGIRLRVNSPKLASKKVQAYARKSVSSKACKASMNTEFPEGFAVVKSSLDPQRDFRDSMVEMIVENNICASKDLENLLACYLSLNSREYHDLIVKAFEQIWYDMAQLRM